ncbi:DUF4913 domain-containing protein [Streptomyces sp. NBC_00160]|uniref:DUF4913 domain-containing protein n=1 Tax=Streptomyces sp. NBC_00160 TaxID=2903628 RepID=UPI0022512CA6|nr:DUF4913 domain-containing protein [Streptomyces sp. NBC_00160]MCX5303144.1 DUF4913 domain-containing protein [Streptomyces sp. NBC_00160]
MPESIDPRDEGQLEPIRMTDGDLEDLEASVRKLMEQSADQARLLDSLAADPIPASPFAGFPAVPARSSMPMMPPPPPEPRFILTLDGEDFDTELDGLTDWVQRVFLGVYGSEITTATPWCYEWQEHLDVVGWLHALWLAWQQHMDPEAGPSGPAVWHRDFLTHTVAAVRAPGGPLSACTTDPERRSHRLLPRPDAPLHPTAGDERPLPGETE